MNKNFTPLTDPFILHVLHDGIAYDVEVTYAKSADCCENLFSVVVLQPGGVESFRLKEKPTANHAFDHMVWTDGNNLAKPLYQELGFEIEQHLKKHLNIFLFDAPVVGSEDLLEK